MTEKEPSTTSPKMDRGKAAIERTYEQPIEKIWALWTTTHGLESWWGPEGFVTTVLKLDLRPGGVLHYEMTATGPEQVEFMTRAGLPLTTGAGVTYTKIIANHHLEYQVLVDFVPGVEAYEAATVVEFYQIGGSVKMVVTLDDMHDEEWTRRAQMGWGSQLEKFAAVLEGRTATNPG